MSCENISCRCCLVVFLAVTLLSSTAMGAELVMVQAVWRHGDRSPTYTFPTDVHQASTWPQGWGQLTALGMQQQYALGARLQSMYNQLISPNYKADQIYVRSTDVDRTLMSAMSNLAGFYQNGTVGVDFPDSGSVPNWPSFWSPVPVHTFDISTDHIGDPSADCPRADELLGEIAQTEAFKNFSKEIEPLFKFLTEVTGMEVDLNSITIVHDALTVERIYNLSMPSWLNDRIWNQIVYVVERTADFYFGIDPYTPELIRLRGGSLLKSIVDKMETKKNCKNHPTETKCKINYYAYSVHDTSIIALLSTFGDEHQVLEGGLPKYAASVVVEFWESSTGHEVKILFHPTFNAPFYPITNQTQGCPKSSDFCPFDTFVSRSEIFIPKNITADCQAHHSLSTTSAAPTGAAKATDCYDIQYMLGYNTSGIYTIYPQGSNGIKVYCDLTTAGGGWTVFQSQVNADGPDFTTMLWNDYKVGFGSLSSNHWLGLDNIHVISTKDSPVPIQMRVDFVDCANQPFSEQYESFKVDSESTQYLLTVGRGLGTAGDAINEAGNNNLNGTKFTTKDRNNDNFPLGNCAVLSNSGGFWYNKCGDAHLNGHYYATCTYTATGGFQNGILWGTKWPSGYSPKSVQMKMRKCRPIFCN